MDAYALPCPWLRFLPSSPETSSLVSSMGGFLKSEIFSVIHQGGNKPHRLARHAVDAASQAGNPCGASRTAIDQSFQARRISAHPDSDAIRAG